MTVKELITLLESTNQESEVVVRDFSLDGDTDTNSFKCLDIQTGFFDESIGLFSSTPEEVDPEEKGVYGVDAIAICIEGI